MNEVGWGVSVLGLCVAAPGLCLTSVIRSCREQLRLIAWLQHRVAELERRQYGVAMPAECPGEERQR